MSETPKEIKEGGGDKILQDLIEMVKKARELSVDRFNSGFGGFDEVWMHGDLVVVRMKNVVSVFHRRFSDNFVYVMLGEDRARRIMEILREFGEDFGVLNILKVIESLACEVGKCDMNEYEEKHSYYTIVKEVEMG
jgi:hypothetical protein